MAKVVQTIIEIAAKKCSEITFFPVKAQARVLF